MTTERRPKVSVLMITYNHEKYIEQAVRSVMMQKTDFDYELVIGEDCSTDGTREVLVRLKEEFGSRLHLVLHPHNIGMSPNFAQVYNRCQGEYIALLEGDDYWIDPTKLQCQVEFLDNHPDCRLISHDANVLDASNQFVRVQGWKVEPFDLCGYLQLLLERSDFVITGSVVFRPVLRQFPIELGHLRASLDWALYTWLLSFGGRGYHLAGEPRSVYRLHEGGVTHLLRPSSQNEGRLRKVVDHLMRAAEDAKIVRHMLGDQHAKALLDERVLQILASAARLAFTCDRDLFEIICVKLDELAPNHNYIPTSPQHLAVTSRLLGYRTAEGIAYRYRAVKAFFQRGDAGRTTPV